ncbi:MAG: ATP-grasp domain-containing protein [Planctomycetota bacterium]
MFDAADRPVILIGASVRAAATGVAAAPNRTLLIGIDQFGDADTHQACDHLFHIEELGALADFLHAGLGAGTPLEMLRPVAIRVGGIAAEIVESLKTTLAIPCIHDQDPDADQFRKLAAIAGVRTPERCLAATSTHAKSTYLIKQAGTSGGMGVRRLPNVAGAGARHEAMLEIENAEPLGGVFHHDGHQVRCAGFFRSRVQAIGDRPFCYAGSAGPMDVSETLRRDATRLASAFIDQTGHLGCFNVDLLRRGQDHWFLEINARYSASMELLEHQYQFSWVRDAIWLACGYRNDAVPAMVFKPQSTHYGEKRIHYPGIDVSGADITSTDVAFDLARVRAQHPGWAIADYPSDGTPIAAGTPGWTTLRLSADTPAAASNTVPALSDTTPVASDTAPGANGD